MIANANLDVEATWSGVALPAKVRARIAAMGALMGAFADEVCVPVAVEPSRIKLAVRLQLGYAETPDLWWAQPTAKAANDRRLAQRVCPLPGAFVASSLDELDRPGDWIAKAPWTAAGRDRVRLPLDAETRRYAAKLLARHRELVVEPWCTRLLDFGVCAHTDGTTHPPHGLVVDSRGQFIGIDLRAPDLTSSERDAIGLAVDAARTAIVATGYAGPFAIDGFRHTDGFHPLCEINARYTFGWIARALGVRRLGFGPPPSDARVLIAPTDDDPTCAWAVPE